MARVTCGIDVETYSSTDLTASGVHRYAEAYDFEILLLGYCFSDEDDVRVIDLADDEPVDNHPRLRRALLEGNPEGIVFTAWNAAFERTTIAKHFGVACPPEQWECTMTRALMLGLPGGLAAAGAALGLPEDKLKDARGKALINYFSKPCRPTKANGGRTRNLPAHDPDRWKLYKAYNRQDVVTEQEILRRLEVYRVPESERRLWQLDQRINDRGVRVDVPMVEKIVAYDERRREELQAEARKLTGLANPNSLQQLKAWLQSRGAKMASVTKDSMTAALAGDLPPDVRRVLEIRQALGKTSVAKYATMLDAVCKDGRLRGILQFYGANRTGRWAGRLVQTHNLARNSLPDLGLARELAAAGRFDELETLFGEPAFVFSELVRTAFIPSDGRRFVVSDFSAIEARVISWLAGEEWRLDAFRSGKDIYCETASAMYHVPVVKHGVNGELRQRGKVAELACGYQGGVGAMRRMDTTGTIPEEELQATVDQWRTANPRIVRLWRDYENAARIAIEERRTVHRGIRLQASGQELEAREAAAGGPVRPYSVRKGVGLEFSYAGGNLFVRLPSGRSICYWGARIREEPGGKRSIVYHGVNQETKQWGEAETYGGKIVENIVQAVARDCLAAVMQRVEALEYEIVMHVHDEIIVDVPSEDTAALERINAAMSAPIDWAPGLPLKGDGYETPYYKKD